MVSKLCAAITPSYNPLSAASIICKAWFANGFRYRIASRQIFVSISTFSKPIFFPECLFFAFFIVVVICFLCFRNQIINSFGSTARSRGVLVRIFMTGNQFFKKTGNTDPFFLSNPLGTLFHSFIDREVECFFSHFL